MHILGDVFLSKVFSDHAISGAKDQSERHGLMALFKFISSNSVDFIVFESLDRISRDAEDIDRIHKITKYYQAKMYSVNEGWVDDLMIGLKGTMNAIYIRETSDKVLRSHREIAKNRRIPAGLAYGYCKIRDVFDEKGNMTNGLRRIQKEEAIIIKRIFKMFSSGCGSKEIAQRLNLEGIPSPKKGRWSPSTILGSRKKRAGILFNDLYRGKILYNFSQKVLNPITKNKDTKNKELHIKPESEWVIVDAPEYRIIDDQLWYSVQNRLLSPNQKISKAIQNIPKNSNKHLSGIVCCGLCGTVSQRANGERYICGSYRRNQGCKNSRGLTAKKIKDELFSTLTSFVINYSGFQKQFNSSFYKEKKRLQKSSNKIAEIELRIKRLLDVIEEGINTKEISDRIKILQNEKTKLLALQSHNLPEVLSDEKIKKILLKNLNILRKMYEEEESAKSWKESVSLIVEKIITTPILDKKEA